VPAAEIEEIAWIDTGSEAGLELAPLTRDHVLPLWAAYFFPSTVLARAKASRKWRGWTS